MPTIPFLDADFRWRVRKGRAGRRGCSRETPRCQGHDCSVYTWAVMLLLLLCFGFLHGPQIQRRVEIISGCSVLGVQLGTTLAVSTSEGLHHPPGSSRSSVIEDPQNSCHSSLSAGGSPQSPVPGPQVLSASEPSSRPPSGGLFQTVHKGSLEAVHSPSLLLSCPSSSLWGGGWSGLGTAHGSAQEKPMALCSVLLPGSVRGTPQNWTFKLGSARYRESISVRVLSL